jgi:hypothetical protein
VGINVTLIYLIFPNRIALLKLSAVYIKLIEYNQAKVAKVIKKYVMFVMDFLLLSKTIKPTERQNSEVQKNDMA